MKGAQMAITLPLLVAARGSGKAESAALSTVESLAAMSTCAKSATVHVDPVYDGLDGHDLNATFDVSDDCAERWWKTLNATKGFDCVTAVEFRACKIGGILPGQDGLLVGPRDKDVLILKRNGKRYQGGHWN